MNHRTKLNLEPVEYGRSELGVPLSWIPAIGNCKVLIIAAIHGEEPETCVALSRAYRSLLPEQLSPNVASILCANPDGIQMGTRGNAKGVDLNRNFPTGNWQPEPTTCRWFVEDSDEIPIETGVFAGSEVETQALVKLIEQHSPETIIALHGPLACVDDPEDSTAGRWIAKQTGLPLVPNVGYETPGSLGTWCAERDIPIITWEFPLQSVEEISRTQSPVLEKILSGNCWEDSGL